MHKKEDIEAAIQHYDRLLQKQDVDSISLMFTPEGELGGAAKGRAPIKKFLAGFASFKVLSQTSTSDTIAITGDSAFQKGHYHQVTVIPSSDTVRLTGEFTAHWNWNDKEGWLIKRIDTKPEQ